MSATGKLKFSSNHFSCFFFIALFFGVIYLTFDKDGIPLFLKVQVNEEKCIPLVDEASSSIREKGHINVHEDDESSNGTTSCDLYSGKWVYDINGKNNLPYKEGECSFLETDHFTCEKFGRKNLTFQNWRWQPNHCDLPRFNATKFMEKIRGKKLIFVGDSVNRNQWQSMLCLIESSLSSSSTTKPLIIRKDNLFFLEAKVYNATIGFYWSPLLVESSCDDPTAHTIKERIFRITSIEKHAIHWTDADILIFNSFSWWLVPNMKILWGPFGSPDPIYTYPTLEMRYRVYELALQTWSEWLELNINKTKTKMFFMSLSPPHFYGESWQDTSSCYNTTEPNLDDAYWGIEAAREIMNIAESTVQKLEKKGLMLKYLNITRLSEYRRDAHPSIYRPFSVHPTEEQLKDPRSYSDCTHWCLPGVPDVWNAILHSYIIDS